MTQLPDTTAKMNTSDLAQIIRDNPGCTAFVDNDCWHIYNQRGELIANSDDYYGCNHGIAILWALGEIVGMEFGEI